MDHLPVNELNGLRPAKMSLFDQELNDELAVIRTAGLHRRLRRIDSAQGTTVEHAGRGLLNFSSNDYLGLANHPALKEAAIRAIETYGAGAGASRLVCGSLAPHHDLEELLAEFKGTEAALGFSTGYAAAAGAICALLQAEDIVILDKLVHASIIDASRLCGAKIRVFPHNDLERLEALCKWADARRSETASKRRSRILIVTESVFSMDGDRAPLAEIVDLKDRYGAWLMVDEAHATGLLGRTRTGLAEACGVSKRVEIQMGTLGKAIGSAGGYICGSSSLIELLVNRARTFIFSTAPAPGAAAAAAAGIRLIQSDQGEQLRDCVWQRANQLARGLHPHREAQSAIVPIAIGAEQSATDAAALLLQLGLYVPAIRFPTVPRGKARLRVAVTASHTAAQVDTLLAALKSANVAPSTPRG